MEPLIIPIHDRRLKLAERMDLFGHAVAALGLLTAAMDTLPGTTPAQMALGAVELLAAAALAGTIVREVRAKERTARISWLNVAAAAVLLVEWYARWSAGGKLVSPPLVSAIVALALAFLHPRIQHRIRERWSLRLDDHGILLRTGRFRRAQARWSELRSVESTPEHVVLNTTDGREQRIRLRLALNGEEIAAAVRKAAEGRVGMKREVQRVGGGME